MLGSVLTAGLFGIDAFPVECEADLSNGLPSFDLVGFLSSEVREARERVRSALHNSDISLPPSRLTINLSPANRRKAGNSFDLPIAVCVLTAAGLLTQKQVDPYLFSGELGLDGSVKPVNGAISLCACAKAVVFTGATGQTIKSVVTKSDAFKASPFRIYDEPQFDKAVRKAASAAEPGDIVILSPACASFDAFKNFMERGERFREIILGL